MKILTIALMTIFFFSHVGYAQINLGQGNSGGFSSTSSGSSLLSNDCGAPRHSQGDYDRVAASGGNLTLEDILPMECPVGCSPQSQAGGIGRCIRISDGGGAPPSQQTTATTPAPVVWGAACKESLRQAEGICDMNQDKDIQGAMSMANGIKNQMENAALSNLQVACNGMGRLSQAVNAGLTGFKTYCATQVSECTETCKADYNAVQAAFAAGPPVPGATMATQFDVDTVRDMQRKCTALNRNVAGAEEGLMKFMQMDQAMKNCSLLTGNSFMEQCRKDPTSSPLCTVGGATDCSNPQVAMTNMVCKCRANPGLAECGGTMGTGGGTANRTDYGSGSDTTSGALGNFGGADGGGDSGMINDIAGGENKNPDGSLNRGGAGKASIGESGGTGNRGGGQAGAAAGGGSGLNAKIIGGYGFGGAAGGGYQGGGGSQQGGGGYNNGNPAAGQNGQRVDLRQFLPGGRMDPSRGLAGISGPDGITGPNSDIWKKINTRYSAQSNSLLP